MLNRAGVSLAYLIGTELNHLSRSRRGSISCLPWYTSPDPGSLADVLD